MALPQLPKEEESNEDWMGTYADAITLLMAFFVLFFSFSRVDLDVFDQVSKGLSESIGKESKTKSAQTLKENIVDQIESNGASEVVKVASDAQGSITLELDSGAFFKPGSAELQEQAIPVLNGIADEVGQPIYSMFNINIEGHTDDEPINSPRYQSNWELSSNRASAVVRSLINHKKNTDDAILPKRLRAIGYADTQPKLANLDTEGKPIPENRAANRRVVMRINRQPIYEEIKIPKFRREEEVQAIAAKNGAKK
jgi:chemotaxis protein MotB